MCALSLHRAKTGNSHCPSFTLQNAVHFYRIRQALSPRRHGQHSGGRRAPGAGGPRSAPDEQQLLQHQPLYPGRRERLQLPQRGLRRPEPPWPHSPWGEWSKPSPTPMAPALKSASAGNRGSCIDRTIHIINSGWCPLLFRSASPRPAKSCARRLPIAARTSPTPGSTVRLSRARAWG